MIKLHSSYTDELIVTENCRIIACSDHIKGRPAKRLPPTHLTSESGTNFGIDPQTGKTRIQPLLYPTPITGLKEVSDALIYLPNTKYVDFHPSVENIIKRGQLLGFGERHFDAFPTIQQCVSKRYHCRQIFLKPAGSLSFT